MIHQSDAELLQINTNLVVFKVVTLRGDYMNKEAIMIRFCLQQITFLNLRLGKVESWSFRNDNI